MAKIFQVDEETGEEAIRLTAKGGVDRRGGIWITMLKALETSKEEAMKRAILDRQFDEYNRNEIVSNELKSRAYSRAAEERREEQDTAVTAAEAEQRISQIEGVNNLVELAAYDLIQEAEKAEYNEAQDKLVEKARKKMAGEAGFRGMIKATKEGWQKLWTEQKDTSELFGDMKDSFSQDFSFISGALSPLMELPGVNAALSVLKFAFLMLWKGVQKFFAWRKARAAKEAASKRLAKLKEGITEGLDVGDMKDPKGGFLRFISKFIGFILGLVVGLGVAIGAFFGKITKPFRTGGAIWKLFGSPKWVTTVGNWFSNIFGKTGKIATFFAKIKGMIPQKLITAMSNIGKMTGLSAGVGTFSKVVTFMRFIGATLGKFFWPITLLMGAWESVKGFIAGFKDTEGSMLERIAGGLYGAVGQLIDWLIMWPADMIKDMIAWLGEKMGFDMSAMKDFSFSDLWKEIWGRFTDGMLRIVHFFKALGIASIAGIKALAPLGLTPKEAFHQTLEAELAKPVGSKSRGTVSGMTTSGGVLKTGGAIVDGNRNLEDITLEELGLGEGNTVGIDQSVTVNNEGAVIRIENAEPTDRFGSRIAGWFRD